jgi:hypothetical protein
MKIICFLLVAVLLASVGQLLVKFGINHQTVQLREQAIGIRFYLAFLKNPHFLFGMLSYMLATLLWIYILTLVDLNFAMPFMSLSYIFIMVGAYFLLHESLSFWRIAGTILVCLGLIMISIEAG